MSELTLCNYCKHSMLISRAKRKGMAVSIRPGPSGFIDAYVHPAKIIVPPRGWPEGHPARAMWLRASYMELTKDCVC